MPSPINDLKMVLESAYFEYSVKLMRTLFGACAIPLQSPNSLRRPNEHRRDHTRQHVEFAICVGPQMHGIEPPEELIHRHAIREVSRCGSCLFLVRLFWSQLLTSKQPHLHLSLFEPPCRRLRQFSIWWRKFMLLAVA